MKKSYLLMATVSALVLTACSSDDDFAQPEVAQKAVADNQAVGFDVYVPNATTTRAGLEGTMTTGRLQRSEGDGGGFGVYAFLVEDAVAGNGATTYTPTNPTTKANVPNFMVNEKVLWNNTNLGWYYSPLKYWPNQTNKDSQSTPAEMGALGESSQLLDRLTFFAYAPYVAEGSGSEGITAITDNAGLMGEAKTSDPTIAYGTALTDPNKAVDLLWGVAPAGGLTYTAVNGSTVNVDEGKPLIDMTKPDVNTNMKFLFEHSLARIGVTVVAAIDQVSPGGELDPNTKITINSLELKGWFGATGELNLNNGAHAHVANWTKINNTSVTSETNLASFGPASSNQKTLVMTAANGAIAPSLRYAGGHAFGEYSEQEVVGVTTTKQDLITPSTKWFSKLGEAPAYSPAKKYYSAANSSNEAHATYTTTSSDQYYTLVAGVYTRVADDTPIQAPNYPAVATSYYTLTETGSCTNGAASAPDAGAKYYTKAGNTYTYVEEPTWGGDGNTTYYTVEGTKVLAKDIRFAYTDDNIYAAERNFFMVVPTNNVKTLNSSLEDEDELALRTIDVKIEYYITTEDKKVKGGRTQTKNVIEKKVVFPSLANGKSYNLNLILGLTSVKMEAEVDDWKVINVNADLPQNTAE